MPELPEVETIVRDLRPLLTDRKIVGVRTSKKKLRRPWLAEWNASAIGAKVEGLRRRGKWILVDLAGGPVLRAHMGMSGEFTVVSATKPHRDHLHVVFELDNGTELRLRDPRRFGSAEYFPDRDAVEARMNAELGPEPSALDPDEFRAAITGTARSLKAILLDQTVVAGVGNIYADESLFRAKLHPARKGESLKPDECDRLREAIGAVLTAAIEARGTDLGDGVYLAGKYKPTIFGRTGEPCPACKTAIACVKLAGRSSHHCPECQRMNHKGTKGTKKRPTRVRK
jgi:formamidopyrimidine-DNA glycosylase